MSVPERLRSALDEVERGDDTRALAVLVEVEWLAFNRGQRIAGEIGFVRWRLAGGDRESAVAVLRRLVIGRRA